MKKLTQCYGFQVYFHLHQKKEPTSAVSIASKVGLQALPKIMESFPFGDKYIYKQVTDLTSFSFHRP